LYVVAPIDLALSKVSRFEENDREDIAELARHNLIDPAGLVDRAEVAMGYYIGDTSMLRLNLKEALDIIRAARTGLRGEAEG
jgi:hypothetical protein